MNDDIYTCDTCDTDHPRLEGFMSEAGFECDACYDKRIDREFAEMRDYYAIYRNYPDLHHHVRMQESDPVGFYYACKGGTI